MRAMRATRRGIFDQHDLGLGIAHGHVMWRDGVIIALDVRSEGWRRAAGFEHMPGESRTGEQDNHKDGDNGFARHG